MTSYFERIFKNLLVVKIPFAVFALFSMSEFILSITSSWPLVFWGFYYLIYFYLWSWLLASWLTSDLLTKEQSNPNLLPRMVQQTFFHQIKLCCVCLPMFVVLGFLIAALALLFIKGFANLEELRSLQIGFGGGELVEPGLSFFYTMMFFCLTILLPLIMIIIFRFSYGILPLLKGDTQIGFIGSWRKSKGTNLVAFKLGLPYVAVSLLLLYLSISLGMSDQELNSSLTFVLSALGIVALPMFFDSLTKYLRLLNSDHLD